MTEGQVPPSRNYRRHTKDESLKIMLESRKPKIPETRDRYNNDRQDEGAIKFILGLLCGGALYAILQWVVTSI